MSNEKQHDPSQIKDNEPLILYYPGREQGVHRRSVTLLRRAAEQVGRVGPQVLG